VSTVSRGRNFLAWASSRSALELAVRAATRSPSCSATSSVWRPMEPVAPKIEIVLLMILSYSQKLHIIIDIPDFNCQPNKRCHEGDRVEPVQDAPVSRQQVAVVLHPELPLDDGEAQVADLADDTADDAQHKDRRPGELRASRHLDWRIDVHRKHDAVSN